MDIKRSGSQPLRAVPRPRLAALPSHSSLAPERLGTPIGQTLLVTFGCGWVQREGGRDRIKAGCALNSGQSDPPSEVRTLRRADGARFHHW